MNPEPFQRIAITGAGGTLGRALLAAAAEAGLSTAALYRSGQAPSPCTWAASADLADPAAASAVAARMEAEWGPPHALIHAAGAGHDRLFARLDPAAQEALLDANLRSALHIIRATAPLFLRQGFGSILLIGSLAALRPRPGQAVYAAAKGALESLTRALAREFAPKNIRVNAATPGFLDSPMVHRLAPSTRSALLGSIPLGRLGTMDETARACLFLASPAAAYLTGQVLRIDGGASC